MGTRWGRKLGCEDKQVPGVALPEPLVFGWGEGGSW